MKPKFLIVHHSAGSQTEPLETAVNRISELHRKSPTVKHTKQNGFGFHCAYHYMIDKDGSIMPTRPENEVGHHCGSWWMNIRSVAICLLGNFQNDTPSKKQLVTLSKKIIELRQKYSIPAENVKGHRDVKATACPGKNMTSEIIYKCATTIVEPDWLSTPRIGVNKPSNVHKPAWDWGVKNKVTGGKNPKEFATREEVMTMIFRNNNLK